MCGIAGFQGLGSENDLSRMIAALKHRGPDDRGVKVFYDNGEGRRNENINKDRVVGLAHSRLSIIDLSASGHQPMSNEDETVWVIFNGEIYNFKELRRSIQSRHTFKSQSDTEVLVHLFEEIGTEIFSKIYGMFAIAIYDLKKNQLTLGRDRMGKKPLYWGVHGKTFIFGSELKALVAHPSFKREIDLESLNKYMLFENVPTPHSIFKNTWKLEPGTMLIWNGETALKRTFWKPTFLPKTESFDASLKKLDDSMAVAVQDRLVADVPLGIFLSGGLDSSTIAYYAAKGNLSKIKTFSIGFEESSYDESKYAREVAGHIGTEHFEKILSVSDCIDLVPAISKNLDEPLADASIVPTYLLSKFAREHVTVALGGDGGDELFCGYDPFLAHRAAEYYRKIPAFIRDTIFKPIAGHLPTSHSNMSLDFVIKKFVGSYESNPYHRNQLWLGAFDGPERQKLFSQDIRKLFQKSNEFEDIDRYVVSSDSAELYDRLGLIYERMYMMDQVLVKVDRASMMNSLEVRAPFLDTRVVDLANHMPSDFKLKGMTRKYILKKLMEGRIPKHIIHRKKKGFGMPVAQWINGGLKPLVLEHLGEESISRMGLFDAKYVNELLQQHFSHRKDNRKQIWTLLVFAMWYKNWM